MEIEQLAQRYGNFHVPAFAVRVGREDLVRDHVLAVSQIEVDLVLGAASRVSFTVADAYSFKDRRFTTGRGRDVFSVLRFGAEIELSCGYGDARSTPLLFSGVITEITTNFPEAGSPDLQISGYDHAFPMTGGKNSRTWAQKRDSDAAAEIASFHNLDARIDKTAEIHPQIEQNQESDFEFLKKLADRNHFELFVDEQRTLHFHPPADRSSPLMRLAWGSGLISFKPEANLAGQISRVEVYGWDPKKKERIIGIAGAGAESGKRAEDRSAAERLSSFVREPSKQPVLRLRQPVFSQAEANSRAVAALNERAKQFLTGDAEAIGIPDIRPNRTIKIDNLGEPFSKIYFVQQATHKIDANGYRTRFKVKETGL